MAPAIQAKVLRVLEEGTFMRLGGTRPIQVDVRIIAATNRDLKEATRDGSFREDLFYRLNVMPLRIPPLRDRPEDVMPLALDLMQYFNRELKKSFTGFTPAAAEVLRRYPWPGNIRELKNVVERTMILAPPGAIDAVHLPKEICDPPAADAPPRKFTTLDELEDRYITEVLAATGNNKTQAARILGIHPSSLFRRLAKAG